MFCGYDFWGEYVIQACKIAHLHVPEEVAVIGVNNDEFICDLTDPPLSSISLNTEIAGYEAAAILDRLIAREKITQPQVMVHPIGVVTRQSTDVLAIKDSDVVEAVRFIRQNIQKGIQVDEVANAVFLSCRTLYKKFQQFLGHSVHAEIKRARIEVIGRMLLETDLSVSQIALTLWFPDIDHISRYFQSEKGANPLDFRKKFCRNI